MKELIVIIICYLIGSIPFGYIIAKIIKKIDIRDYGSGNIGATNAFRILGPWLASFVLIGDLMKGYLSIYLFYSLKIDNLPLIIIGGLAVIGGHNWSIFLKFKGGKGIATTYGVVLALNPMIAAYAILGGITVFIFTKYVSLASMSSVTFLFILMVAFKQPYEYIIFGIIIVFFAFLKNRAIA